MPITNLEPEELRIVNAALEELCAAAARQRERDRVLGLLLGLAGGGVTTVDDLVARARDVLEKRAGFDPPGAPNKPLSGCEVLPKRAAADVPAFPGFDIDQ
ncbi:MAG: hypothetical protein Q8M31_22330 [Beijerinckiaceae bacterium]|nr:hypothetical protein [Beijerinckiaceae bacterium]